MTGRPKVTAVILARPGSSGRADGLWPEPAMVQVMGRPILAHIVRRLALCQRLDGIVLAVGNEDGDRPLIEAGHELDLKIVAGPDDVLKRMLLAGRQQGADHVAGIQGNFPLVDPWALDKLIEGHLREQADYSSNSHYNGAVYGLGAEIISLDALQKQIDHGHPGDCYSGTLIFPRRADDFKLCLPTAHRPAPEFKASLDFPGDEKIVEAILKQYPEPDNNQVIDFFIAHPDLASRTNNGPAEVGLQKIMLFPEKLSSLQKSGPDSLDFAYPITVELSLTNRCNQNCLWCSDKSLRDRSPDKMNISILKNLFADLAEGGATGITIEGGGEPTMADFFEEAVHSAKDNGLAVGLITNGLDLFPPDRDPAVYKNFEWIRISLDAADSLQYRSLKGVDGFDRILANIGRLAALVPDVTLGVGYVLTNLNDGPERLQDLALTLRSIGVNYLQIRPVVDHPDLVSLRPLNFLKKFETPWFSVNLSAMTDNQPSGNQNLPCLAHSLSTVIGADGAVWFCGRLNTESDSRPIGDLTKSSFRDIWNGSERASQAAQAASPQFCQANCPQCRMTKYNQLLADLSRIKTRNFI